jgi:toxin ParE1/3/4
MSAHRLPVVLTRRAREDFEDILLHSQRNWGEAQRLAYALAIDRALQVLSDNPNIGRARDDLAPGYRSYLVEQHVILYLVTIRSVSISRIIHNRMDARRALQPSR